MMQGRNPNPSIFQSTPISIDKIIAEYGYQFSCIFSLYKNLVGIYHFEQYDEKRKLYSGEIAAYTFKNRKWIKYCEKKVESNTMIKLLSFNDNDQKLLFSQGNSIECLNISQIKQQKECSRFNLTIQTVYQFSTLKQLQVNIIQSNDFKLVLIQADKILFFDAIQQKIMSTSIKRQSNYVLLGSSYFAEICFFNEEQKNGSIRIYDSKYQRPRKYLKPQNLSLNDCDNENHIIYSLNEYNTLVFCYNPSFRRCGTIYNMVNPKIIRKIVPDGRIHINTRTYLFGVIRNFMMLWTYYEHKNNILIFVDLFYQNFQELAIQSNQRVYLVNQILIVQSPKGCQFWIPN